ncbi:hypothetical protein NBRC10512v2_001223 [Rhodotorula toruloides]
MSHPTPPEPLLGSAWLLAQTPSSSSTSSSSRTEITPSTCLSFTHFKTLLDSSRRASDDAITTRLNRASALSGSAIQGRGGVMGPSECEGVWRELCARWDERRKAIEFCDGVVEGERERLGRNKEEGMGVGEEKRLSADWKERGRGVVDDLEFKRTRLSTESSIERILRQRTLSLFFSRCPSFHPAADVPAEPPLPRVRGDEEEERERERRRGRDERGRVRWT